MWVLAVFVNQRITPVDFLKSTMQSILISTPTSDSTRVKGRVSLLSPRDSWLSLPLLQDQWKAWPCVLRTYRKRDSAMEWKLTHERKHT